MQQSSIIKPIVILAGAIIVLTGMYFAASVLAPIFFALFIAALLTPIHRWLRRRMSPPWALLGSIGVLGLAALLLALLVGNSVTVLINSLASYEDTFLHRKAELEAIVGELDQVSIIRLLLSALDPGTQIKVMGFVLNIAVSLVKSGLLIFFVTVFFLGESHNFKSRLVNTFGADHSLPRTASHLVDLIIGYFGLRTIVNLVVAVLTGIMLWLFGIPYAGLWAVLCFFLSFIPYIGAFVSTIPPVLLAYAQGGLGLALVIIFFTIVINSITENAVQPLVMGKGLSVSPTVVFLSFVFWLNILGGLGAFVAMPLTLALILVMQNFEETRGIAAIMATVPEPVNEPLPQIGDDTTGSRDQVA
jgi:AI-2 transport protein TqsA